MVEIGIIHRTKKGLISKKSQYFKKDKFIRHLVIGPLASGKVFRAPPLLDRLKTAISPGKYQQRLHEAYLVGRLKKERDIIDNFEYLVDNTE